MNSPICFQFWCREIICDTIAKPLLPRFISNRGERDVEILCDTIAKPLPPRLEINRGELQISYTLFYDIKGGTQKIKVKMNLKKVRYQLKKNNFGTVSYTYFLIKKYV
jgi:hypothetical protein